MSEHRRQRRVKVGGTDHSRAAKRPTRSKRPSEGGGSPADLSTYHEEALAQNEQLQSIRIELEQSRHLYARLYDEAPVGYLTLDRNGVIEKTNITALRLLGTSRELVVSRPLLVFVHPDDRGGFLNFLLITRRNVGQGKHWVEIRLCKNGGEFFHVQLSSVGVGRESGRGMMFLTAFTDITGRIEFERDRRVSEERVAEAMRQRAAAQAANEAKDRFLAMLSHELRTPLTPALLRVSAMAVDPTLNETHREDLEVVLNNIRLEVRLIDDLLDLSRILRGKFAPDLQHIDLRDVIREAIDICQPNMEGRRLTVLPSVYTVPLPVHGDRVRLEQVIWNILRNAIKFTPEGGHITVNVIRAHGNVRLRITDTGIGIDQTVLPKIFEIFEQGSGGITRKFGGLGLGLAISKAIVQAHGGSIEADSEGNHRGATFTVSLPLDTGAALEAARKPDESAKPKAESRKNLRILLVEDHDETRTAMTRLLTNLGYELDSAPNAADATRMAHSKHFDLLISDLGLPDRDGYQLMRDLRANQSIKGIALSGFGMERDLLRSKEVGFEMHMVKPVTIEALQSAIDTIFPVQ